MDIAKYIGLFLLKNNFCYVHGIGNIEIKRLPASFDGKLLLPATYEVVVTTGGSIDDNLAYFIASNEQVSISKASNELRDFSTQFRKDLEDGKEVLIPGIGKFKEVNGIIKFTTIENFSFTPAGMPTIRNHKQIEETAPKPAPVAPSIPIVVPEKKSSVNWMLIIIILIILVIIGGGVVGYLYYKSTKKQPLPPEKPYDSLIHQAPPVIDTTMKKDSLHNGIDTTKSTVFTPNMDTVFNSFKMIIDNYPNLKSADAKLRKLKITGAHVEIKVKDTANYMILTEVRCRNMDTAKIADSLSHVYKYQDVKIFR